MRYYFDTNSLRKYSKKLEKISSDVYTSSLALFELISGISESDYHIRKETIKNILSSNIHIDWDTYKSKFYKAFKVYYNDIESFIIKEMAKFIMNSKTFSEIISFKIYISECYYNLESFSELDKEISKVGIDITKCGIKLFRQEYEKSKIKNIKTNLSQSNNEQLLAFVRPLAELQLIMLFQDVTGKVILSKEYFTAPNLYDKSLDLYLFSSQLQFSLAQLNGSELSKNDCMDILHLVYMSESDTIVSDDKIFENLSKYYYGLKNMNLNDYSQL